MKHYLLLLLTLQFACHSFGLYTPRLAKKPSYSAQVLRATPISAEVVESILSKAVGKALEGGTAGASAAAVQVLALMWLRTTLNYQYRFGTSTGEALSTLWKQGGIVRLYQGLPFALLQGPLSRFGDTASNALALSLVESLDVSGVVPLFARTGLGSLSAGAFRIVLMPIDTAKTSLQVNGEVGLKIVADRVAAEGPSALFSGALASSAATVVGHYPWFLTYNTLSASLPTAAGIATAVATADAAHPVNALVLTLSTLDPALVSLLRSALIGLFASSASDICSNSLRVLKTTRQTDSTTDSKRSYYDTARAIVAKEGLGGLFGRGLQTRLLANALQGTLFSVLFTYFQGIPKSKHINDRNTHLRLSYSLSI